MLLRLVPILSAALALGGCVYLIFRFRRFGLMQTFAGRHKLLSWFLAASPVGLAGLFGLINAITLAVVFGHLVLVWLLCDGADRLVTPLLKAPPEHYWAGAAALLLTSLYLAAGWFLAHHVFEVNRAFSTEKALGSRDSVRIAALSDSHIGITLDGEKFAALLNRVQEAKPDAVVIVGDFVDDDTDQADMLQACEALGELETTYGVYFVYGNHDNGYFRYRNFTPEQLRQALEENGVTVLEDQTVLLDDSFYIVGRQDRSMQDRASAEALTAELDRSKYIVMLDHQPNDYTAEVAAGADLVISGHTHGGHIFPAGQIGLAIGANDKIYGAEHRDGTDFVVTSGVSGWAIPFKTGAISEYVIIDIQPSQQQT